MEVGRWDERLQAGDGRGTHRGSLILAGDSAGNRQALVLADPLVGKEEENLVLDDRAAEIGAELVTLERGLRTLGDGVEEVSRIQGIVAQKLKQLTVIFVCARSRREVHNGAGVSSVLRRKRRIVDLVFRQRVNRRLEGDLVLHRIVQIDSVHQPVGRVLALAGSVNSKRALAAERCGEKTICGRRDRSRREQTEVREVSSVQWDLLHRLVVDHLAHACCRSIDERGVGHDLYFFRSLADAQLNILRDCSRHLELEV